MTMGKTSIALFWSSGKDSALTALRLIESDSFELVGLITTHVEEHVPFQHASLAYVETQAKALGLPLLSIELPTTFPSNETYQTIVVDSLKRSPFTFQSLAFGDLYLDGIAEYRKNFLEPAGWQCHFPLLGEDPKTIAQAIIQSNIKTFLSTIDSTQCPSHFLGREFDSQLLSELPESVDPCGERGEFHTIVYQMPHFAKPITVNKQQIIDDNRFHHQQFTFEYNALNN